jgi:hypothetical protein
MPMLMPKCKKPVERSSQAFIFLNGAAMISNQPPQVPIHCRCVQGGHKNEYVTLDYIDWS